MFESMTFQKFFLNATGYEAYPFQQRFAEAPELPHLVRAPTGAGKTATAVLGWLWRWMSKKPNTPRRLVYCLPMRVLVEQSFEAVLGWLHRLEILDAPDGFDLENKEHVKDYSPQLDPSTPWKVAVHRLMGGAEKTDWYLHPERPAILIGTQDMLLSRALNRGYGASRFRWPIDFGLLNNDCLWIFDEPQLMGSGVSTSAQLAGLRQTLCGFGSCPSVWMSATLEPSWLDTIDFKGKFPADPLELEAVDYAENRLYKRMNADKTLHPLGIRLTKEADDKEAKEIAAAVLKQHHQEKDKQTLVVLNTVRRATKVYQALVRTIAESKLPRPLLIHSRFRPVEREERNKQLHGNGAGRIIIATQVVEAGVDISAATLITELAPWASIVQRVGRCNRTGDDGPGQVFWIDLDDKIAAPYEAEQLEFAREQLAKLEGKSVSPKALDEFKQKENITLPFEHKHVLRRRDLLDLFDTSPDLSGNDIDIQRFVRGDDPDTDVQVFWRDINVDGWDVAPHRNELCNVPVSSLKAFLKKGKAEGLAWDHLDELWRTIRDPDRELRPGLTILLPTTAGGYSELGWDPDSKATVIPVLPPDKVRRLPEGTSSDPNSFLGKQLTMAAHTEHVYQELADLLQSFDNLPIDCPANLLMAARWHDVGKAHSVFQDAMYYPMNADPAILLAKSGRSGMLRYCRKHFRHELGSALAVLHQRKDAPFLVAYLIAAHHGRVRLSIRALPGEVLPVDSTVRFALGVHDGDLLPEVDLGKEEKCLAMSLDLTPMQLGGDSSWTARALKLLGELGPFKLAYLEGLIRAADVRASKKEAKP